MRREVLPDGGPRATQRALETAAAARSVILVEGFSDQIAIEALASRLGRDLAQECVAVVPIGGAQAIDSFLARFGSGGVTVAGLCDEGEEEIFRRALEQAGLGPKLTREEMARLGFFVCVADLEDELIRALGPARVELVIEAAGDAGAWRTFRKQPQWRERSIEGQLRRWLGSADRRKLRYARLLVEALDPAEVPRPLAGVLAHV